MSKPVNRSGLLHWLRYNLLEPPYHGLVKGEGSWRVVTFETAFGTCRITTMVSTEGAALVVKSAAFRVREGETVKFKATVKEHSIYKGQAQTVLTRCKLSDER